MANEEHLAELRKGVYSWNEWRRKNLDTPSNPIRPDFSNANLMEANLMNARLMDANLWNANLWNARLMNARLMDANLMGADFRGADLRGANLGGAYLFTTDFRGANLRGADLMYANLSHADLMDADLSQTIVEGTIFGNVDLSVVKGLETVNHKGPSTIGIDTIYLSQGNIPEAFLKGAGVDDTFIIYIRSLIGSPIAFYSCFISYSSQDETFARRIYADLQSQNVRCWFAPEDLKIGEKFWQRIDESIRISDKLLVVLSQHSIASTWVEREVLAALEKEERQQKLVLFPISVDETFKHTFAPWAADIRRSRHTGDFTRWKDHDSYERSFKRLLRDLKAGL